jgi:TRAP-type C4-dicarboxylate transport system substrate-binding protein
MMPFLIEGWDHKMRVWESDLVQEETIPRTIEEGNQRPLGRPVYRGQRQTLTKKPVREPADIEGVNIRMPEIDSWVEIWSELGASPTPVALDELYSALNSGVVSATEGPAEMVSSFNLDEVLTHMAKTAHRIEPGSLFFNEDFYQGLDETYQEMMSDVATEVTKEASQTAMDREQQLLDELSETMTILEPPEVDREAFYTKAEPALERMFDERFEGSLEEIRSM